VTCRLTFSLVSIPKYGQSTQKRFAPFLRNLYKLQDTNGTVKEREAVIITIIGCIAVLALTFFAIQIQRTDYASGEERVSSYRSPVRNTDATPHVPLSGISKANTVSNSNSLSGP